MAGEVRGWSCHLQLLLTPYYQSVGRKEALPYTRNLPQHFWFSDLYTVCDGELITVCR